MSKYTPGPWTTLPEECDRPYIRIRGTCVGGRYKIANVITPMYEGVHEREAEETRANARLIAAAPELLGFVLAFIDEYGNGMYSDAGLVCMAEKVRDKATGEQQ